MQENQASATEFNLNLGKKIRLIRKNRNFSLSKLAKRMNVSYQQLQKYETGTNRVSAEKLAEIAQILSIDPICFFPSHNSNDQIAMLENQQLKQFVHSFLKIENAKVKGLLLEIAEKVAALDRAV